MIDACVVEMLVSRSADWRRGYVNAAQKSIICFKRFVNGNLFKAGTHF